VFTPPVFYQKTARRKGGLLANGRQAAACLPLVDFHYF
jgi:hypothetical protein